MVDTRSSFELLTTS